jgi:thiamine biosynthesis protein ThiI
MEGLREELARLFAPGESRSFAVRAKREDKSFPLKSPEIEREVGGWIADMTGWRVDLKNPDTTIHVEWMRDRVWFYWERTPGPGGMPIGISGKAACLMSGGIDSPVAAYLLMKRGCPPVFVHFHSFPFTDSASQSKVCSLVEELCRDRCSATLHMIPFAELQQEVVVAAPPKYRILLYRRFMLRIAQEIALQEECGALVTGDSLAQVSSQTMENLAAINAVARMPVFRPLIGWDKQEIIERAKEIGTFDLSILPHDDCCSWFMPQTLELRANCEDLDAVEQNLDVPGLVKKALAGRELRKFGEEA